jgi:biotin synthase
LKIACGKSLDKVIPMIQGVKAMGMETCVTLGMLTPAQAFTLPIGLPFAQT